MTGGVARCRERDRIETTGPDVVLDAGQRTIRIVWQRALQELSQRCGIQQAARWLLAVMAAADQAHTPPSHVADERERADVVHLV